MTSRETDAGVRWPSAACPLGWRGATMAAGPSRARGAAAGLPHRDGASGSTAQVRQRDGADRETMPTHKSSGVCGYEGIRWCGRRSKWSCARPPASRSSRFRGRRSAAAKPAGTGRSSHPRGRLRGTSAHSAGPSGASWAGTRYDPRASARRGQNPYRGRPSRHRSSHCFPDIRGCRSG